MLCQQALNRRLFFSFAALIFMRLAKQASSSLVFWTFAFVMH